GLAYHGRNVLLAVDFVSDGAGVGTGRQHVAPHHIARRRVERAEGPVRDGREDKAPTGNYRTGVVAVVDDELPDGFARDRIEGREAANAVEPQFGPVWTRLHEPSALTGFPIVW